MELRELLSQAILNGNIEIVRILCPFATPAIIEFVMGIAERTGREEIVDVLDEMLDVLREVSKN